MSRLLCCAIALVRVCMRALPPQAPPPRPGDYLAIAVDYVEDGTSNDPEYLESIR